MEVEVVLVVVVVVLVLVLVLVLVVVVVVVVHGGLPAPNTLALLLEWGIARVAPVCYTATLQICPAAWSQGWLGYACEAALVCGYMNTEWVTQACKLASLPRHVLCGYAPIGDDGVERTAAVRRALVALKRMKDK